MCAHNTQVLNEQIFNTTVTNCVYSAQYFFSRQFGFFFWNRVKLFCFQALHINKFSWGWPSFLWHVLLLYVCAFCIYIAALAWLLVSREFLLLVLLLLFFSLWKKAMLISWGILIALRNPQMSKVSSKTYGIADSWIKLYYQEFPGFFG